MTFAILGPKRITALSMVSLLSLTTQERKKCIRSVYAIVDIFISFSHFWYEEIKFVYRISLSPMLPILDNFCATKELGRDICDVIEGLL